MADQKRLPLRGFIKHIGSRKGKELRHDSTVKLLRTSPDSQGRVSAALPSTTASSTSVTSSNATAIIDLPPEDVSVGTSAPTAQHGINVCTTESESQNQQAQFQELWKEAIVAIRKSKDGDKLTETLQILDQATTKDSEQSLSVLISKLEAVMKRVGMKKRMAEAMETIIPHLNRFAIVGDIAVSTNPNPAALPWAAVRFLLLNLTAGEELRAKVDQGIAEITILVFECSVYHELYLTTSASSDLAVNTNLRKRIINALSQCIKLLGFALRHQHKAAKAFTDAFRLEDFSGYLKDLSIAKDRLHNAGLLCEMHHGSQARNHLKLFCNLMIEMRLEYSQRAEEDVKVQLRDLLIDPKDVFDHIYYPPDSFCLEGTRVQVLKDIEEWSSDPQSPTICWLPGLAGTGKSTISRTVSCNMKDRTLSASFVFKKGAGSRGSGRHLFAVLAYQLALQFPPIRPHILQAVRENHSLAMTPIQIQWQKLIVNSLVKLQDEGLIKPVVFVLDALDECNEQDRGEILRLLLTACPRVLRVFVTSRPELDIMGHFVDEPLHREIVLHKLEFKTIENDFCVFLRQSLEFFVVEHNRTHRQKHLQLSSDWPGDKRFRLLLGKALPLFIAAATFVRMIRDRHWARSPDYKIDFIIDNSSKVNSEYDTLYKPVLSLMQSGAPDGDLDEVKRNFVDIIGSLILLASPLPIKALAELLGIDAWAVSSQIDPLRSVIDVPEDDTPLQLFHLSFRDYILSRSAGELQVDGEKTHASLANRCLKLMQGTLKADICGLRKPGKGLSDIETSVINQCLPPEVQYASLYWVHHLKASGKRIRVEDDAYSFLQDFFTNWLESIVDETSGTQVRQFIQDSFNFIRYFRAGIEQHPLQLYHSGVIFNPKESIAPNPLNRRQYPNYIKLPSNIDLNWPQSQALDVLERLAQISFLPDNKLASICYEGQLRIWDQRNLTLERCSGTKAIAFSSDGRFMCSVCDRDFECVVLIHCLETGECISEFEIPDKSCPVHLSPQGQWIATIAKESMFLSRWNPFTTPSWTVLEDQHDGHILHFSNDGTMVASLSSTSKTVKVWSTESSKCLLTLNLDKPIAPGQFSLTKDWLVITFDSYRTAVLDIRTGAVSKSLRSDFKVGPIISDDGTLLAGQSHDDAIRIWDLASGALTESSHGEAMGIELVTPIADGNTILSQNEGVVKLWNMQSGACKETLEPEAPFMHQIFIAAATGASTFAILKEPMIEIWSIDPLRQLKTFERELGLVERRYCCLAISANRQRLAISPDLCSIEIWNVGDGALEHTINMPFMHFPCIAFSSDGAKIAYYLIKSIEIRCLPGLEPLTITTDVSPEVPYLRTLTFHGNWLVGINMNTQVQVWDASTGESIFLSKPYPELRASNFPYSFLSTDAIIRSVHRGIEDLEPYYISQEPPWLMKNGEKLLWLPPDYRPQSVYISGTTMVLGTLSGRVVFLYLKE
ncbi:vegetatible incompatibility het-e-1 [Fusarium acutatum]|uniref:Vegetatible incompatibility het-e-1 n=1 Tax=Fusarium acutatum TaxID=78861 RepID=A0A8H4JG03_9HYPO|nr:vegetatible incompatibility het-e-1 [Fusarium acutatum]